MPLINDQSWVIIDLINQAVRNVKAQPMNLGGVSGTGGGEGRPPGGFIGQLIQTQVAYDTTEAATLATSASGSLVDNLNHIRYRLDQLELSSGVLTVEEYDGSPSVNLVDKIIFSGAVVTDLGGGDVIVSITASGGSGTPFTGDANSVVLTDSGGSLDTVPWLTWGTSTRPFIEFGADVAGKETNAGRIGYGTFGSDSYFYIVGAGTTAGDRRIQLYDKAYASLFQGGINIPSMNSATVLGTDSNGNIVDNTSGGDARYAPVGMYSEGWVARTETWTRTGNYTFTLSGDYTNDYRKGVRVKYTDSGGLDYGTIISSSYSAPNTTVTLATNSDYAMAAGSISSTYISYQLSPRFYPDFFNFTISGLTASGSMTVSLTATTIAKFKVGLDGLIYVVTQFTVTTGGTASTQIVIDAPVALIDTNGYPLISANLDGTSSTVVGLGSANGNTILGAGNRLQARKHDNSNWGIGTGRIIQLIGSYPY